MTARTRLLGLLVLVLGFLLAAPAASRFGSPNRLQEIANATTEIDLPRAQKLLAETRSESPSFALERARLAVYSGDCALGAATLSSPELSETKEGKSLKALAESCARATVSGFVIEDQARGIWLRLQDDGDRALAPMIFDVAARARDRVARSVGVNLLRPLRIDLVKDLFSLSSVSGLPLEAAETTGTLAVARWGRVIMISPRALSNGFPWQDTLAHEITHLIVTRASRDHAPLWLQEGMAKSLETSWREPRPFDDATWADVLAHRALVEGRSVGIDKLGPSIAMLPTPEAASIAFAEVTSFLGYFTREAGDPALRLLFADLRGIGKHGADRALRSVTGYGLSDWNARWQRALLAAPPTPKQGGGRARFLGRDLSRRVRLSDLLLGRGFARSSAEQIAPSISPDMHQPAIRWRGARAWFEAGEPERAREALGGLEAVDDAHGCWFGLHGRALAESGDAAGAERAFQIAAALDPLAEDAACEGQRVPHGGTAALPSTPERRELCQAARNRVRH